VVGGWWLVVVSYCWGSVLSLCLLFACGIFQFKPIRAIGKGASKQSPAVEVLPSHHDVGAVGLPGGICLELFYAFGIGANGLSVNSGDTFNLAVAGVGGQQRGDRCLQVWFQDVQSGFPKK
jgi:hypothetical protein